MRVAALLVAIAAPSAFAASQTWSNAPSNALWIGSSNWIANAVPGGINLTANTLNNDLATFNSPLSGGIGGAGNPILIDDATVAAARSRHFGGFIFDGTSCGTYVINSLSPAVLPATGIPGTGILYVSHNQTTRVNAAVTNSQTILVPMRVRCLLPRQDPSGADGCRSDLAISDVAGCRSTGQRVDPEPGAQCPAVSLQARAED